MSDPAAEIVYVPCANDAEPFIAGLPISASAWPDGKPAVEPLIET